MLAPFQATAQSLFLPRLSTFCRSNAQNVNVFGRIGIRQTSFRIKSGMVRPAPAGRVNKPGTKTVSTIAALGLGLAFAREPTVHCDAGVPLTTPKPARKDIFYTDLPPPPKSSISLYELGFGTVAGLCAGIFVKKGAKAAAWLLGGVFVLLQYLASQSLVKVDWSKAASRFESRFHTVDAAGKSRAATVGSVWRKLVDFLTADFQPRASFIAGFALGIRVG